VRLGGIELMFTEGEIYTLVTAVSLFLTALAGYLVYLSHKTLAQVAEVHVEINHRMDELLTVTRSAAHAAGVQEGQNAGLRPSEPTLGV
jgi:hypothetical protein